jgi:TRAP-type mannitol/chloroaromatic compound transport system, large permease component
MTGNFDPGYLHSLPSRLFGTMTNEILMAVPLFIFMGITLEKAKIAEDLLENMTVLFGNFRGGLAISVILVGMLLAASTGIVGATVVTMGLLSLPLMIKKGYSSSLSTGVIAASGTLGQIIPPSIVLVLLGDVLSSAYQQAQLNQGIYSPDTVSVGDLFVGAIFPGLILVVSYLLYVFFVSLINPNSMPAMVDNHSSKTNFSALIGALFPPLILILAVLGSIIFGFATITEAAGVGAMGAVLLAYAKKSLDWGSIKIISQDTAKLTTMVFMILIGASVFSLVFPGYQGDELVHSYLLSCQEELLETSWFV